MDSPWAHVEKTKRIGHRLQRLQVQSCSAKLVSGTVKFQNAARTAKATLSRNGRIYASGRIAVGNRSALAELTPTSALSPGRYVLTMTRGGRVIERRTVDVR